MSGEELEAAIAAGVRDMVAAGVRPEDMVIEFSGMRWRWSPAIRTWDLETK